MPTRGTNWKKKKKKRVFSCHFWSISLHIIYLLLSWSSFVTFTNCLLFESYETIPWYFLYFSTYFHVSILDECAYICRRNAWWWTGRKSLLMLFLWIGIFRLTRKESLNCLSPSKISDIDISSLFLVDYFSFSCKENQIQCFLFLMDIMDFSEPV